MIICCGEALIDMLPRQLSSGEDVFYPVAGGAIFNTAIALGRLGCNAGMVSGISTDMFGDQLIEALQSSKVDTQHCIRIGQPTTLAFVKLTNGQAQYSFFDENSAGRSLSIDMVPKFSQNISALHFGAISLIPEPCGSAYEALLSDNAANSVISLDPNIRPSFITNAESHRARINRMISKADIVKVSDEDLDWIIEGGDHQTAIQSWLEQGVKVVLITQGADGVTAFNKAGSCHQEAQKVDVVDTIGAGDTFNAGFLAGLEDKGCLTKAALAEIDDENLKHALNMASKVAAFTVSQAGAVPPWREQIAS
ncbi:MAG: carbohydrate kinase [Hyphomicrobiales bacterium]